MRLKSISIILIVFIGLGCQNKSKTETLPELITKKQLDFNKTDFTDRAEELKYIREYLEIKLPEILIEKFPDKMRDAQLELVADGYDVSLKEASKRTYYYSNQFPLMMSNYNENNVSFKDAKWCLDNYKECSKREQNKVNEKKIKNIVPRLKNSTLISIKDTKKNEFIKDFSDDYLTINNHYERYYPSYAVVYEVEKTNDDNIYKVTATAMDESLYSETIFYYYLRDNYFRHIETTE